MNKEIYNFNDKNGLDICLRPERTASLTRYFIENKLDKIENIILKYEDLFSLN